MSYPISNSQARQLTEYQSFNNPRGVTRPFEWEAYVKARTEAGHLRCAQKEQAPLYGLYALRQSATRSNEGVESIHGLTLDLDSGTTEQIEGTIAALLEDGVAFLAYTTFSHSAEQPKWRIDIPLASPVDPKAWLPLWTALSRKYAPYRDQNCKDPSRQYFVPSCPEGAAPEMFSSPGVPLETTALAAPLSEVAPSTPALVDLKLVPLDGATLGDLLLSGSPLAGEGGRTSALLRGLSALAKERPGLDENALVSLAARSVARMNQGAAAPLTDAEVRAVARSAISYRVVPPTPPRPALTFAGVDQIFAPIPDTQWLVQGLGLAPGAVNIFGGRGGAKKTLGLQSMLVSLASGRDVWGLFPGRGVKCAHLDQEQGRPVTYRRYQKLARGMGVQPDELRGRLSVECYPQWNLRSANARDVILGICDLGVELIGIDSLKAFSPGVDENDSRMREPLDMLNAISDERGVTIVVLAHAKKGNKDDPEGDDALRGSSAIRDAAQSVVLFQPLKGGSHDAPTLVRCNKLREGQPFAPFTLEVEDSVVGLDPAYRMIAKPRTRQTEEDKLRDQDLEYRAKLVKAFQANGNRVGSQNDLFALAGGKEAYLKRALVLMLNSNDVSRQGTAFIYHPVTH